MENTETGTRNGADKLNRAADTASQAGQDIKNRAMRAGENVVSDVREGLNDLGSSLKKTGNAAYSQARDMAEQAYDQASSKTREGAKELEREIREYPMYSVLTAFGVGLLFGACWFGGKSTVR